MFRTGLLRFKGILRIEVLILWKNYLRSVKKKERFLFMNYNGLEEIYIIFLNFIYERLVIITDISI